MRLPCNNEIMKRKEQFDPQKISSYFLHEKKLLMIITITGLIYNIGLLAGPYYEGQLAQTLLEILKGNETGSPILLSLPSYRFPASSSVCMYVSLPMPSTGR